jgi:hypothetical protein
MAELASLKPWAPKPTRKRAGLPSLTASRAAAPVPAVPALAALVVALAAPLLELLDALEALAAPAVLAVLAVLEALAAPDELLAVAATAVAATDAVPELPPHPAKVMVRHHSAAHPTRAERIFGKLIYEHILRGPPYSPPVHAGATVAIWRPSAALPDVAMARPGGRLR